MMSGGIVVIGASLGGLRALQVLLGRLDADFPWPIAIVQHRMKDNPQLLSLVLQQHTALTVKDVEDRDRLDAGCIYVAPADYHLLIEGNHCCLSLEAPIWHSRPAIDVLFESAALAYKSRVLGVILTGNSSDGAQGARRVKELGGILVVQDPQESEAPAMPLAAIKVVEPDKILKLNEIALFLAERVNL